MSFKVEMLNPNPMGVNPFEYDLYHMGHIIGPECVVMHPNHPQERCRYIIVVNPVTGDRLQITCRPDFYGMLADAIRECLVTSYTPHQWDGTMVLELSEGRVRVVEWTPIEDEFDEDCTP